METQLDERWMSKAVECMSLVVSMADLTIMSYFLRLFFYSLSYHYLW